MMLDDDDPARLRLRLRACEDTNRALLALLVRVRPFLASEELQRAIAEAVRHAAFTRGEEP